MNKRTLMNTLILAVAITALTAMLSACSSSGSGHSRSSMHYGAGYRGYHNRPWGYGPGYIDEGIYPEYEDYPTQLPAMGMPDMGGMDMGGMDMGGYDW